MQKIGLLNKLREIKNIWQKSDLLLLNGMGQEEEEDGIANMPKKFFQINLALKKCVLFVKKITQLLLVKGIVRSTAVLIVDRSPCGSERVYDLTVPNTQNFTIHDGIVVHNCLDAARYLLLTLRGYKSFSSSSQDEEGVPQWFKERMAMKPKTKRYSRVRL